MEGDPVQCSFHKITVLLFGGIAFLPSLLQVQAIGQFEGSVSDPTSAVIPMVSKSGTNQFHRGLFEFLRNTDLNARNFFSSAVPPLQRNEFGGTIGGPIV